MRRRTDGRDLIRDSMAIYFAFALAAAYINQRTDAQQSIRLDDFNRSSTAAHTNNPRDLPSSGLGTAVAPIPLNNFGITFIDATPGADCQPKIARCERPTEDQEALTNPFADPEDSEDLTRSGLGSQQSLVQEQGTRE